MNQYKHYLRIVLSLSMVIAGTLHFAKPAPFVKIVPDLLPYPLALVYISGFFEILGGVGLLIPPVSQAAAWGLIALFIAVFPANINMAIHNIQFEGIPQNQFLYWARLPFQAVLVAWGWWLTMPDDLAKPALEQGVPTIQD
ncbi:hypothetical protein AVDCRST_MAG94-5470 [uncultured Leptolyngbya sp.]|uniref:Cytoplasmic membrane protein FsxA n=2 Tax=Cyanophyceae TaxID=3028117 RepID=A0A6J4NSK8_9CYAN|nr:hypothetical protein AVDCRST_MAG94-5470 [uncultured Leptolyngbya sp.]CAA9554920.1 hypothetical protein AVDCRST_MAG81-143 [uncultured Synechococcales cyanobacterium]